MIGGADDSTQTLLPALTHKKHVLHRHTCVRPLLYVNATNIGTGWQTPLSVLADRQTDNKRGSTTHAHGSVTVAERQQQPCKRHTATNPALDTIRCHCRGHTQLCVASSAAVISKGGRCGCCVTRCALIASCGQLLLPRLLLLLLHCG